MAKQQRQQKGRNQTKQRHAKNQTASELRIIGGSWKGRKVQFFAAEGLRPTGDRIRETLFNWLMADIPAARCLDLFSGSGALSFEALSRGAAEVVSIEANSRVSEVIRQQMEKLLTGHQNIDPDSQDALGQSNVICSNALTYLREAEIKQPYHIVFLDPPFTDQLLEPAIELLNARPWLSAGSKIYFETAKSEPLFALPENWQLLKEKQTGQVRFGLIEVN